MALSVDIVYAQDAVSVGLPASLAARIAGKKYMVRIPGDYAWEQGRQRWGVEAELDAFQTKKYGWRVECVRSIQKSVGVVPYDEDFDDELTEMANDLCRVICPMVATRIEEYLEQKGILHDD
jgi:hypothetical protein